MIEWLNQTDPKIVQGALTLTSASVASITALIVAFIAYPWQRRKDRAFETLRERRDVYRLFFGAMNEFFTSILRQDADEVSKRQMELHGVATDFLCFASEAAAVAARNYIDAVQEFKKVTFTPEAKNVKGAAARMDLQKKCSRARNEAVARMRVDLTDESFVKCQQIVSAHFPDKL